MNTRIIELVSNASLNVYPRNTISSFTNFLPDNITLEGNWEVALLELSHPAEIHNVTQGEFTIQLNPIPQQYFQYNVSIPPGLYTSVADVIFAMNTEISKLALGIHIDYEQTSPGIAKLIFLKARNKSESFSISGIMFKSSDLAQILGVTKSKFYENVDTIIGEFPIDLAVYHTVMVYSDIVEHGIVGDTKAPLLRSLPMKTKLKDDQITHPQKLHTKRFDNPQFKPLYKKEFHSISVELRSITGELIPFAPICQCRLTLMLRKSF